MIAFNIESSLSILLDRLCSRWQRTPKTKDRKCKNETMWPPFSFDIERKDIFHCLIIIIIMIVLQDTMINSIHNTLAHNLALPTHTHTHTIKSTCKTFKSVHFQSFSFFKVLYDMNML